MTDIERDTERRITTLETSVTSLIAELRDFKAELRDRDNQRAAEIAELRQKHDADIKEMNQRFYAKFDAIDARFDRTMTKLNHLDEQILFATKLYWILVGVSFSGICATVAFDMYCVFSR